MARGRMIDKVIILSQKINAISEGAENLYYRIYVISDDFGLFHADPKILKGQAYTLRNVSIATIKKRLNELTEIGLIKIYEINGERYLEIQEFEKHQTFRKDYTRKAYHPRPSTKSYEVVRSRTKPPTNINKSNINKSNINKNKVNSLCLEKFQDEDIKLTQILIDLMIKNNPNSSIIRRLTSKRQQTWIDECRKLREIDKRTSEQIEQIIIFSQNDSFWKSNILSMVKLREKFDQLWLKAKKQKFSGIKEWLNETK